MRLTKTFRFFLLISISALALVFVVLSTSLIHRTSAISESTLDYYNLNGIYYYNPDGSNISGSGCFGGFNIGSGDNTNYAGDTVWTDYELDLINKNLPVYQEVANEFGFAWQILAVVHSLESGLATTNPYISGNTYHGQGVYGLYDAAAKGEYDDLLRAYKVLTTDEFRQQTHLAAEYLTENYDLTKEGDIKRAFFNYNGAAGRYKTKAKNMNFTDEEAENGEGSPYVMNRFDARRDPTSPNMDPLWKGVFVADGKYNPNATVTWFGAWVKLMALGDPAVTSSSLSSDNDGSNVLIIGDSITNMSRNALQELLPKAEIIAEDNKKFDWGIEQLEEVSNIPEIVVFALGANGGANTDSVNRVLDIVGNNRKVIFVTNYALNDPDYGEYIKNNLLFRSTADNNNNVIVADWANVVATDPDKYLINNDTNAVKFVHPTADGIELFAQTIANVIDGQHMKIDVCNTQYNSSSIPQYYQSDPEWANLRFGTGGIYGSVGATIEGAGCGPTSFAMMATVLLGREILPPETTEIAGRAGMYTPGSGSNHQITQLLAEHYGLQYKQIPACGREIEAINEALNDGWMIHVTGKNFIDVPPFTKAGHYIGITSIGPDGQWYVADSNRRGNQYYDPAQVVGPSKMDCGNVWGIKR